MNAALTKLHAIGARAWLAFLQGLNAALIALLGGAYVVNETYPDVVRSAVAKLPPAVGIPAILAIGILVHYAARRAKAAS